MCYLSAIPVTVCALKTAVTNYNRLARSKPERSKTLIGVGDGGQGVHVPPKIRKKIFFWQLLRKIQAFFRAKIM